MVSLYLMGQYPTLYAPYSTELLQVVCQKLGAKDVPVAADFPRYTKLLQTLRPFLAKDETVMENYGKVYGRWTTRGKVRYWCTGSFGRGGVGGGIGVNPANLRVPQSIPQWASLGSAVLSPFYYAATR